MVEAGQYLEIRRAGEILKVVESFLRHRFQRFQGLKSLELLRSVIPGADEPPDPARVVPCPN